MKSAAVIGLGAIGSVIAAALERGLLPGWRLAGVMTRSRRGGHFVTDLDELLRFKPDLIIEAAGQLAARDYAPAILSAGKHLMLMSVGALADPHFEVACRTRVEAGGGRLIISSGAVGGLDAVKAMRQSGHLQSVSLHSRTLAGSLIQPWMSDVESRRLLEAADDVVAFEGTAREAARMFPAVANVAATVALCSLGLDRVSVTITGAPRATCKVHELRAVSDETTLTVRLENRFSPSNPRTSALTPLAVLRYLLEVDAPVLAGV